jgi:diaminopimelate decarboxylase
MSKKIYERPVIKKLSGGVPGKFNVPKRNYISRIDGLSIEELMDEYGSPVYVVSEKTLVDTYQKAHQAFATRYPKVQFAWSYKTNYLDAVCRVYHREGSWAEVVSGFEFDKALNNGVAGNHIIFNGPGKSEEDLKKAIKHKALIHIDHFDELYLIMKIADKSENKPRLAIRINMDTGIYPRWDRFGFNYENGEAWNALNRILLSDKLELVGLHTHIGTYIMTATAYGVAASKLAELAVRIEKKFNHVIKYIDMGGGFASQNTLKGAYLPGTDTTPSFDEFAEAISNAIINSDIKPENLPILFLETGRALVDDAGYLLGKVVANKRLADGRRSTIINIGLNLLFTSMWYQHDIYPGKETSFHTENTILYGPLCMNIDIVRESIEFPLMNPGDPVVIKRIGAYNMTQWLQFIDLRPKIIMIDRNKKVHVIRENETNATFESIERVPDYLK